MKKKHSPKKKHKPGGIKKNAPITKKQHTGTKTKPEVQHTKSGTGKKAWKPPKHFTWFLLVGILLLTLVVYIPAFNHEFVNWDDDWYILENTYLRDFSISNIVKIFTEFYHGQYSPVTMSALVAVYDFAELNPFYYHALGILIHLINTALVFVFIRLLLQGNSAIRKNRLWYSLIPAITALLFGIHTLQVEVVAWVAAQKVLFYTMFFFLSLIAYILYLKKQNKWYFACSLLFFFLSFGSKEQGMVLSVMLIAIDYYLKRNLISKKVILEKIPFLFLSIAFGIVSLFSQADYGAISDNIWFPFHQRVVFAGYSFIRYFEMLFIPNELSAFYPYPIHVGENIPATYYVYFIVSLLFIVGLVVAVRKQDKYNSLRELIFGLLLFIINIVLTLQIVSTGREVIVADRYVYIPSIGLFLILAVSLYHLYLSSQAGKTIRIACTGILVAYVIYLSAFTHKRTKIWSDGITLWTDVQQKSPRAHVAFYNRANAIAEQGDYDKAIEDYTKAIPIKPTHVGTYSNRGIAYANIGELQKALDDFNKVVELDSTYTNVYSNRGNVRTMLGNFKGALNDYNRAITRKPDYADAYYNRAIVKDSLQDYQGVINDLNKVLKLKPAFADAYLNRGKARLMTGDTMKARSDFDKAKQLEPDLAENYYKTGIKLLNAKKHFQAIRHFKHTLFLNPNNADAYYQLATCYDNLNNLPQVIKNCNEAIKLNPRFYDVYITRGVAKGKAGDLRAAIDDFNRAIQVNPQDPKAYSNRGLANNRLGNTRAALHDYNKAIELDPSFAMAYNNRALVKNKLNDDKGALEDFNQVIAINPKFPEAYYYRAKIYIKQRQRDKACADLEKAAQLGLVYAKKDLQQYCQ